MSKPISEMEIQRIEVRMREAAWATWRDGGDAEDAVRDLLAAAVLLVEIVRRDEVPCRFELLLAMFPGIAASVRDHFDLPAQRAAFDRFAQAQSGEAPSP